MAIVVQKYFPALAPLALLVLLISGCDDGLLASYCSYDSDCWGDEYCIAGQCAVECSHDEECAAGTHCEAYQRPGEVNPVQICLDINAVDNDGLSCANDGECQAALGTETARCGMHNRCIIIDDEDDGRVDSNQDNAPGDANDSNADQSPSEQVVVIVEQLDERGRPVAPALGEDGEEESGDAESTGQEDDAEEIEQGDGQGDEEPEDADGMAPEADDQDRAVQPVRLGALVVRDDDGRALGYGRLVDLAPAGADQEEGVNGGGLAEPEPRLPLDASETCVDEPEQGPYASLGGPGGRAYIELVDEARTPLMTSTISSVQIIADGPECPIGPSIEDQSALPGGEYRVLICVVETGDRLPDDGSCPIEYRGPMAGFANLEVTFNL